MQDCIKSIANALELLQSYTKPLIWRIMHTIHALLCFVMAKLRTYLFESCHSIPTERSHQSAWNSKHNQIKTKQNVFISPIDGWVQGRNSSALDFVISFAVLPLDIKRLNSIMFFNQSCFIYMCLFYDMTFEWECVVDFMHAFYYLIDFIFIYLHIYWVKLDLINCWNLN